jgi:exoribonuclease-2
MNAGNVVEFIDSQKIHCAVVMDIKKVRLRLLTEHNREVKLSVGRLAHVSNMHLDLSAGRDRTVAALKEIASRRRILSGQIDIMALWEILNSEQEPIDLQTMTDFCFPNESDSDHQSAVLRAFFQDRLYFKFSPDGFFPRTREAVEKIVSRQEADIRQARRIDTGAVWMQKVLGGKRPPAPDDADAIIDILSSYYLFEKESPHRDQARAILKKAGGNSIASIFVFLVNIGHWDVDENLDLVRNDIPLELPVDIEAHAQALSHNASVDTNGRLDLRSLPLITIDGPSTLDFDDALSLVAHDSHLELGIHIADVGHYISKDDPIDRYSRSRGSSIYLPEDKISMMPARLSEQLCSLRQGEDKLAVSTRVRITPEAEIIDFDIAPSVIRVQRQLTFPEVDDLVDDDQCLRTLHAIAIAYRNRRLANGALVIDLPETTIVLDTPGVPQVAASNRDAPARLLVSELMILANELAARLLTERQLPAIFRSQPEPRERLFKTGRGTLFQNWMQRKLIHRFVLSSAPEPHSGLGLPSYVTATSPIRKYFDLVTQRQLRAAIGLEPPYTRNQIDAVIADVAEPMAQVGRMQRQRQRYWLLKYLESRIGRKEEAMVLAKRRNGYSILLTAYMLECSLSGAESIKFKPEDLVRVTLQHVSARNDVISVYLG